MINLNEVFERGERWHAVSKDMKDVMFCNYNGQFAPFMNPLSLTRRQWELSFGYKFIDILPDGITWAEYIENYHNEALAEFKKMSLENMCERLRKIYVDCESNVKNFNNDKKYSKFREILNNAISIRHGKSNNNSRPATKKECVEAFKEYQAFIN